MTKAITPASVFADVATFAEAKAIVADVRATYAVIEAKFGVGHPTTKIFSDRYDAFVDELVAFYDRVKAAAA